MSITVHPVTSEFVAKIGDVDLSAPLSTATVQRIKAAFAKYAVLVFPDQHLTAEQHLAVAEHFGPIQVSTGKHRSDERTRSGVAFADISNINDDGCLWEAESRQTVARTLAGFTWVRNSAGTAGVIGNISALPRG